MSEHHQLRYSPALDLPNTWRLAEEQDGVDVRVRHAEGAEVALTGETRVELRYRRTTAQAPGAIYARPTDALMEVWVTESVRLHPDLPRDAYELMGCPVHVAEALRLL